MREKIETLKFIYETKIKLIDVDLENVENEINEIKLVTKRIIYYEFVQELDKILAAK